MKTPIETAQALTMSRKQTLIATILEGLEETKPDGAGFGEEHMAAMRLANAAPELLEALKEITTFFANACQCKMSDGFVCIVHRTKKAISKAEGRVKP